MADYTFTTETGWHVHEYRPFSISSAVRQTPGLSRYGYAPYRAEQTQETEGKNPCDSDPGLADKTADLLTELTGQKLKFDYLSWDIIRQMVEERVQIRDKHRKDIMGKTSDLSGEIYCCHLLKTPDSSRQKAALEKTKLDLEKQAREGDIALWKDLTDLRKELIISNRQYQSTRTRSDLVSGIDIHDGDKEETDPVGPGYLQRD